MHKNYKIFISLLIVSCIMFALPMPVYAESPGSIEDIVHEELQYIFGPDADISFSLTPSNQYPYHIGIQHDDKWINVYIPDPMSMYEHDDFIELSELENRILETQSNIHIVYMCVLGLSCIVLIILVILLATRISFRKELEEKERKNKNWSNY